MGERKPFIPPKVQPRPFLASPAFLTCGGAPIPSFLDPRLRHRPPGRVLRRARPHLGRLERRQRLGPRDRRGLEVLFGERHAPPGPTPLAFRRILVPALDHRLGLRRHPFPNHPPRAGNLVVEGSRQLARRARPHLPPGRRPGGAQPPRHGPLELDERLPALGLAPRQPRHHPLASRLTHPIAGPLF